MEQQLASPVLFRVGALATWAQASAGRFHTACVTTAGTLFTWGDGSDGELGDNGVANLSSPVQVGALTSWTKVASGNNHTIAATRG
jgi:alpha-tubulin suppressor-like RCC1 family protein